VELTHPAVIVATISGTDHAGGVDSAPDGTIRPDADIRRMGQGDVGPL
jgi:hypothetical protein